MNAPARVAVSAEAPARHRFTVDDVWRMVDAGLIDPEARMELIDGDLIDMPSEGEAHLTLKILLTQFFAEHARQNGVWCAPDATLHLAPTDAPEPDLYILPAGAKLKPVDPGAVYLTIEIADTSIAHDLGRKSALYARYGIGEYWVVNAHARRTYVLRSPEEGGYREVTEIPFEAALAPLRLPSVKLVIADLPGLPTPEAGADTVSQS